MKIKICGLFREEDIAYVNKYKPDYIGFVFADSRRKVSPKEANTLAQLIPASVKKVGVFVSPSLEELQEVSREVSLDLIQIHGDYDEACRSLGLPIIRALAVGKDKQLFSEVADYYLFDAPTAGSGVRFDWEAFDAQNAIKPYFIAGGLTPENVTDCIAHFHPYAVDVSSGVETDGKKDVDKIKAFIKGVKHGL